MFKNAKIKGMFSSKAKQASLLVFITYAVAQVLRLGSNLILTRLLIPDMFGVMAIAYTLIYIVTMLSDVGIGASIIRSRNSNSTYFLHTAWTMQVIRGFLVACILALAAFTINSFQINSIFNTESAFADPNLVLVLYGLTLIPIITGFKSTKVALANRNLNLGKLTIMELSSQVISIIVMIVLAYYFKSIWALVVGSILGNLLTVILSHLFLQGQSDRFGLNAVAFKEIFNFGKWVLLSSLITALLNQGDRLIFGNFLTSEQLGIYSIALLISTAITQIIQQLNAKVFFPKLSSIHRDKQNVKFIYYSIRKKTDLISYVFFGFLFITGPVLINILFDDRYEYAGVLLSILSFQLLFTSTIVSGALYMAIGKIKYHTQIVFSETIIKLTMISFLFQTYGFETAIYGCALFSILIIPIDFYLKYKIKVLDLKREFITLPFVIPGILLGIFFSFFADAFSELFTNIGL